MPHRTSTSRRRRRHSERTVRTVRTTRRNRTTIRRQRHHPPARSSVALQLRDSIVALSHPEHGGTYVIIKVSLVAVAIVLPLLLVALGVCYLAYRQPSPSQSQPESRSGDDVEKEFHVIDGKILIMKKERRAQDSR